MEWSPGRSCFFRRLRNFGKSDYMSQCFARTSSLILPGALLAVLVFATSCGDGKGAKAAAPQAMPVKAQTAKAQKFDDTTDYVATLKSPDSAPAMPQPQGLITKIFVHPSQPDPARPPLTPVQPPNQHPP